MFKTPDIFRGYFFSLSILSFLFISFFFVSILTFVLLILCVKSDITFSVEQNVMLMVVTRLSFHVVI